MRKGNVRMQKIRKRKEILKEIRNKLLKKKEIKKDDLKREGDLNKV